MATLRAPGAAAHLTTECALCAHHNPRDARFCCACGSALGEGLAPGAARRGLRIASTSEAPREFPPARWIGVPPPEAIVPGGAPRTLADLLTAAAEARGNAAPARVSGHASVDAMPDEAGIEQPTLPGNQPADVPAAWTAGEPPSAWLPPARVQRPVRVLVVLGVVVAALAVPALLAWRDLVPGPVVPQARLAPAPVHATVPARADAGAVTAPEGQMPVPAVPEAAPAAPSCPPEVDALGLCSVARSGP